MPEILSMASVSAGYGATIVLEDVTLALPHGSTTAVLGRNGVGKTSLLLTIMGLTAFRGGAIIYKGNDISALETYKRYDAGISIVPQERAIFPSLTVQENITVGTRPGAWTLQRVYDLFPRLCERRANLGNQLSGGEQQMLALGRALMGNPELLLLDEPFEGLAPVIVDVIGDALLRIKRESAISMILVEHHVDLALDLSDRAVILDRGQIVWSGLNHQLVAQQDVVARLIGLGADPVRNGSALP